MQWMLRGLLHPTLHEKGRGATEVMTASLDLGARSKRVEGLRKDRIE